MKKVLIILVFVWVFVFVYQFFPYDDTDDKANDKRSGVTLRIDYGTGCQYLESGFLFGRTLVPRYNSDGKQVCNDKNKGGNKWGNQ